LKVRSKIVADGLDKSLNWESAGYDMHPVEWHEKLKEAKRKRTSSKEDSSDSSMPLVFDCRNRYETSVGIFDGAEPLDTENFRESWDKFHEKLKDKPKDTPIMTYCTGGKDCWWQKICIHVYLSNTHSPYLLKRHSMCESGGISNTRNGLYKCV
jgi:predicted sulfurtransferase